MRTPAPGRTVIGTGLVRLLAVATLVALIIACAPDSGGTLRPAPLQTHGPAAPAAPATTAAPRSFTVLASGDVLLHTSLWHQARADARDAGRDDYVFGPMFESVRGTVSAADLAICHMETPLGEPYGPFSSYPIFNGPPQVATALADIGYDTCTTASNHSLDKGAAGVARTLDVLDAAGLQHSGTARNPVEAATPTLLRANGVTVASISYTFSFNGLRLPRDKPWLANPLDMDAILFDARRARIAGAQVVIVSLHFGTEYQHAPNSYQVSVARRLLSHPDIDLIIGHHAHVVQPLEKIGDKWVAYGVGNQVSNQTRAGTRDGLMPRFTFTEISPGVFRVTKAEVIPTHMWISGSTRRLLDIPAVLAAPDTPEYIRGAALGSLRRIRSVIATRGSFGAGLVLVGAEYL